MVTEDYVSFDTAKLLKEKGFNEKTYRCYNLCTEEHELSDIDDIALNNWELDNDGVSAPTLQMAMKWLREVHKINVEPVFDYDSEDSVPFWTACCERMNAEPEAPDILTAYNSYEEAAEDGIRYCLENLI